MNIKLKLLIGTVYLICFFTLMFVIFSNFDLKDLSDVNFFKNNQQLLNDFKSKNIFLLLVLFSLFSIIWILLLGPVISIALNFLKPKIENKDFYGYGIMANYHSNFFAQGIVYQIWREKIQGHCSNYSKSALYPFFVVLSVLFYGVNFPGN